MVSFWFVCMAVFSVGLAVFLFYVLVRAVQFFDRAIRALDIYLSEKAQERYKSWPPHD